MEYTRPYGRGIDVVQCPRGHRYDPSKNVECPICAEEERMSAHPLMGGNMDAIPPTGKWDAERSQSEDAFTERYESGRRGDSFTGRYESNRSSQEDHLDDIDEINVTKVKNEFAGSNGKDKEEYFNPLVGWLVCVEGPSRGSDYRIYNGYNYIGRDPSMNICISDDPYISHDRHAMVAFDARSCRFFFGPANGKSVVRKNDEMVMTPVEIRAKDIVEIGTTKLMLVPLCDETFTWN